MIYMPNTAIDEGIEGGGGEVTEEAQREWCLGLRMLVQDALELMGNIVHIHFATYRRDNKPKKEERELGRKAARRTEVRRREGNAL